MEQVKITDSDVKEITEGVNAFLTPFPPDDVYAQIILEVLLENLLNQEVSKNS